VVRLDVRAHPDDPSQRAVFASIANVSTNVLRTDVELSFDGSVLETRPLDLAPTNTEVLIFTTPQQKDGVFTVRLTAEDELRADNQASIVSQMPAPVRTLLVTKGNRLLEKALKGYPQLQLNTAAQLTDDAQNFDVCVLDDVLPAIWPKVNTLAIHVAATNWFSGWSTVTNPPIVDWKSSHPLLRFVNFDNVQIAESLAIKAPSWALVLVETPQTPVIVAGELNRQRLLWLGFDPLQSTWPWRISFPIFVANAVEWLNPASIGNQLLLSPGKAFRWSLPNGIATAQITGPDGRPRPVKVEPDARELVITDTLQQGIYHVKAGTNSVTFCVNLLDANESRIAPKAELPLGKYGGVQATTMKRANAELWRWIAGAGMAVLLFEWWWYHKRTA
jgi:hypothetical protein